MAKIDVYLRSIERFGAAGALLQSGQSVTLRFPTGDRHATQVTPHDQLVALVREIAPAPQLDALDKNRPARFELDSNGKRYAFSVAPGASAWQVEIGPAQPAPAPAPASAPPPPPAAPAPPPRQPRAATAPGAPPEPSQMAIERGQYEAGASPAAATSSGSALLDQLTSSARTARASDVFLVCGAPPMQRVGGALAGMPERGALDAETLSRELGVVAPAAARQAWSEHGAATFAYGDGVGRVRVSLARDQRGPCAALRLLVAEAPPLDRLGLGELAGWLAADGLVLVGGPSGSGKTTTLAALVRELGEKSRRVVAIEDPIEIVHITSPFVSQRAVGEHAVDVAAGVAAAMREGADAIVVGAVTARADCEAVVDAVAGGHLVLATIASPTAAAALDELIARLPAERRDAARALLAERHVGSVAVRGRGFEIVPDDRSR